MSGYARIMKTSRVPFLPRALLGLAAFLPLALCPGRAEDNASPQNPPLAAPTAPPNLGNIVQEDPGYATATATWAAIKDYTYARRADFIAGLGLLSQKLDDGIRGLNAKRAGMTDEAAKDWDFNAKELNDARAYLQSMSSELEKATDSTWSDAKGKVAQAWQRVRDAYDKVKHSTTS